MISLIALQFIKISRKTMQEPGEDQAENLLKQC